MREPVVCIALGFRLAVVGIYALIRAGVDIVPTPVARIHRHHIRQFSGACNDALQRGFEVLKAR